MKADALTVEVAAGPSRPMQTIRIAIAAAILLALLVFAPGFLPDAWVLFLTGTFIWIAMAWTWSIMAVAGYISLAGAAWFGLGAYSTAVLMNQFDLGFVASLLISAGWVALFSVCAAIPLFRLRSHYFIMGTLIIAEVIYLVMNQIRIFGIQGASLMHFPVVRAANPAEFNQFFYNIALTFLLGVFAIVFAIRHSRMGLALRAIGQDESTAEALGVSTTMYKLLAFGISSAIFAIAGSIFGYWVGFVQQAMVFTMALTIKTIVISVLGGTHMLLGSVLSALLIQYLEQVLGPSLAELNRIIYGGIVMVVVVLFPLGVGPMVARWIPAACRKWFMDR
jgi:branched-chain amino acid transport system permease protein